MLMLPRILSIMLILSETYTFLSINFTYLLIISIYIYCRCITILAYNYILEQCHETVGSIYILQIRIAHVKI